VVLVAVPLDDSLEPDVSVASPVPAALTPVLAPPEPLLVEAPVEAPVLVLPEPLLVDVPAEPPVEEAAPWASPVDAPGPGPPPVAVVVVPVTPLVARVVVVSELSPPLALQPQVP